MLSKFTRPLNDVLNQTKRELSRLRSRMVDNLQQHIGDYIVQTCFLFGLSGIVSLGMIFVIPSVYSDNLQLFLRLFGYFLVFQLILNWFCIKFVDTSYKPSRDGIMPDGVTFGQDIFRFSDNTDNNNIRPRKDAATFTTLSDSTEKGGSNTNPLEGDPKSYLSWAQCVRCNRPRPPRSHHCPICDKCVLKRDHHCFFTGVCIGGRNLRHFTVFVFWSVVSGLFACVLMFPYYFYEILPYTSYFDIVFPVAFTRALFGYIDFIHACCILFGWFCLGFLHISCIYLRLVVKSVYSGKTYFESKNDINIKDTRSKQEKIEAVFGPHWKLNFLLPLHLKYESMDDTVNWPTIVASND